MAHLRRLAGMMEELVQETGCSKSEIGAVAASAGPGSYTGIRIGVTTARMTAQALGVPCLKVPTLAMFRPLAGDTGCAVIFNARRGQVYGAVYGPGGQEVLAPGPYMLEDVTKAAERAGLNPVFYGDGILRNMGACLRGRPSPRRRNGTRPPNWQPVSRRPSGNRGTPAVWKNYCRITCGRPRRSRSWRTVPWPGPGRRRWRSSAAGRGEARWKN